jgi:hypothetical protein
MQEVPQRFVIPDTRRPDRYRLVRLTPVVLRWGLILRGSSLTLDASQDNPRVPCNGRDLFQIRELSYASK